MAARIYRPAKTAMQSGKAKTHNWIVEFVADAPRTRDPLMGWTGSSDTRQQLKLSFESKVLAIAYAKRNGLAYRIVTSDAPTPVRQRKSYADNFKWGNIETWTH
jgi:hypothetical protein